MTDLTKLIELQAAATPGPWVLEQSSLDKRITGVRFNGSRHDWSSCTVYAGDKTPVYEHQANTGLIAAARNFDFAALDEKIKRYEEALRFYADEDEYYFSAQDDDCGYSIVTREGDVIKDAGQRARKALEK